MKIVNWKTTLIAVVGFGASMLAKFVGFELTPEHQMAIVSLAMLLIGIFAKDSNVTGGTKPATTEAGERT